MKILTPGHKYELANFEESKKKGQTIQFIEKRPVARIPGTDEVPAPRAEGGGAVVEPAAGVELETINDGTTNEEVLAMMIDRMRHLQTAFPCAENVAVITNLETALGHLEQMTKDRQARGVEGKQIA